jgi:mRNA interferase MazF
MVGRGEIWWTRARDRCPVLIIQADDFNQSRIQSVICVLINSDLRFGAAPGNVMLTSQESGLPRDAVVNVAQVVTLQKSALAERCTLLCRETVECVEDGLRISMGL